MYVKMLYKDSKQNNGRKKIQICTRHNVTKIVSQCHTESDATSFKQQTI